MPIWWFDHNGTFGTEAELRSMINTFKTKNVGIIEDVVINHKAGVTSWCDFAEETWNGHTLTWSMADICRNDEAASNGYEPTGNEDTGDNFDGTRDLDHKSENVQQNVLWYLDFLLNDLGYAGFRYDMVKGYNGEFTGLYNAAAKPRFSVGEYWDNYSNTSAWINTTAGYGDGSGKSAAFDFPLKFIINDVFKNENWDGLAYKGLIGVKDYQRWSVTFVDNHDTYRDANSLSKNVLAANALILALPGTPCIFLPHWKHYKPQLKRMIMARKAAGITNQSETWDWDDVSGGRVIETKGTNGQVLVICGYVSGNEYLDKHLNDNYQLVVSGDAANPNFAFYMSKGLTLPDEFIETEVTDGGMTIYVDTDPAQTNAHLYTWKNPSDLEQHSILFSLAWPGDDVSVFKTKTVKGKTWYYRTYETFELNAILNNGNSGDGNQTENIMNLVGDQFFTYTGGGNYENVTDQYIDYIYQDLPACATPQEGTYAYFENTDNWSNVYVHAWNDEGNITGAWPGMKAEKVGQSNKGHDVYRWTTTADMGIPTFIIFNNGGNGKQTDNLEFVNAAYYNVNGERISVSTMNARYVQLFCREFTAGARYTVCLPFSLNEEETESLTGKMYEMSGYENGYLFFSSVDHVEAFKPYIFVSDETGKAFYKFAKRGMEAGETQTVTVGDFSFIGTTDNQTIISDGTTTCYDYSDGQLEEIGTEEGMEIAPYRAYFSKRAASAATFKGVLLDNEGVATSIEIVPNTAERPAIDIYTIQGIRVSQSATRRNLPKGVYVVNGRKLVVK